MSIEPVFSSLYTPSSEIFLEEDSTNIFFSGETLENDQFFDGPKSKKRKLNSDTQLCSIDQTTLIGSKTKKNWSCIQCANHPYLEKISLEIQLFQAKQEVNDVVIIGKHLKSFGCKGTPYLRGCQVIITGLNKILKKCKDTEKLKISARVEYCKSDESGEKWSSHFLDHKNRSIFPLKYQQSFSLLKDDLTVDDQVIIENMGFHCLSGKGDKLKPARLRVGLKLKQSDQTSLLLAEFISNNLQVVSRSSSKPD